MQIDNSTYNSYNTMMQYRQEASTLRQKEAEILPIENPAEIQPIEETPSQKPNEIDQEALLQKIDERKDATRQFVAMSAGINSIKSQFEIYMEGMTGDEYSNETIVKLEDLREIQRQNNIVKAYAYYQENAVGA